MDDINQRAVEFFKNNKKYKRIFDKMGEKYRKRGRVEGSIELKNPTEEERLFLCKIKPEFIKVNPINFTIRGFLKTFKGTEFENMDLNEVVKGYFKDGLLTEREQRDNKSRLKQEFYNEIILEFKDTGAASWLESSLENKNSGYYLISREYEKDRESLRVILKNLMTGINVLSVKENEYKRLAIFASQVTRDPHYFDSSTTGGKLLLAALAYFEEIEAPSNSEEENELLYRFGIIKDGISNYTTCSGVKAYSGQKEHLGISGFIEREEPVQLNLYNLSRIDKIQCRGDVVFVFENPTVFSEVLEATKALKPSLLCTSGQLKLASIVFLDKIKDDIKTIYYSGDFDPEGINIAWKLKKRYGDKLQLWRYDTDSYLKVKSEVKFDALRIKQIESIDSPELKQLIEAMKNYRTCGYQELLVGDYVNDIVEKLWF